MGRYMTVVLKKQYRNDGFIDKLNAELTGTYGADTSPKFNPWHYLQEEADYINNHPDAGGQLPGWERPVTKETLSENFFWMRHGEFHLKISGGASLADAREALAVCKWIAETNGDFIMDTLSNNYHREILQEYIGYLFADAGYDTEALWDF